jgi:FtsP/CotA-like multicopper oxidase with cupredoxin domain
MHKLGVWTTTLALVLAGCGSDGGGEGPVVETFRNPPEIKSANGELHANFAVASATFQVEGRSVTSAVYNGMYIPPVMRLKPGDTLFLDLDNRYTEQTNMHYHGLNVSPRINANGTVSDNIFVMVDPGARLNYQVAIPSNHNPGLYWFHTHRHELAERQVMGGLSGGLIIDGVLDPFPQLQGITERVMLLKDIQITPQGTVPDNIDPSAPSIRTVNGLGNPTITIHPGETQFLRIANVGADIYYKLKLDGHKFYELARDGNRRTQLLELDEILLPPASRSEVLIQGGRIGRYAFRALAFDTGPAGDSYGEATLATLVSQGEAQTPISLALVMPVVEDFRTLPVARKRTITFDESADGNTFYIDSGNGQGPQQFDANRVDSTIQVGTVEEWTVLNATQELHVFHIHQTDFQIIEVEGVPVPFTGHQDNVNVAYAPTETSPPGQVKLLIDFRNPDIVGKFVYHCHILEHEDGGMMAVAEVVPIVAAAARAAFVRVSNVVATMFGRDTPADREAQERADRTLAALQSGSYCSIADARNAAAAKRPAPASGVASKPPTPAPSADRR